MFGQSRLTNGNPCVDCSTLVGGSIANEPHSSLRLLSAMILAPQDFRYYECRACGAKLLRSQKIYDTGLVWRLA